MKTKLTLLALCLGFSGAAASAADSRLEVIFNQPEKFRDVKEDDAGFDKDRDAILEDLKDHLDGAIKYHVPEGQKLTITFNDIDMAGDFEPWRGSQYNSVRIVKDIYPPRILLTFKLVDATGAVLKEGDRKLFDNAFLMKMSSGFATDPLRHEKTLLDDWLREEFPKLKAKDKAKAETEAKAK